MKPKNISEVVDTFRLYDDDPLRKDEQKRLRTAISELLDGVVRRPQDGDTRFCACCRSEVIKRVEEAKK